MLSDRPCVLIVDDVEDNRELYGVWFEQADFVVEHASDGVEALAKVAMRAPDVVIMDIGMPNMDGIEATRRIKEHAEWRRCVVIVLTGHTASHDLDRARAAGADDVCTKPCSPADVLALAKRHLVRVRA